jgi:hypothetical protein
MPDMRKSRQILLAIFVVCLALVLLFVFLFLGGPPKLTINYLGQTNDTGHGRVIAFFAITNCGKSAATSYNNGDVEALGRNKTQVACKPKLHRLLPGQGDVISVFLPPGLGGRWRFTASYAHAGLRSRISDWQWGPGGPGPRANWFIPRFLKGVPLDVTVTSEWVDK